MYFEYTALNSLGAEINGTVEGQTRKDAIKKIRDKGLFPVKIKQPTKIKQIEDSAGERKTSFDEEVNKIEEEMGTGIEDGDEGSIPPPDLGEDENSSDEPELDINVLFKEVVKLYNKYEPLLQKMINDGAVKLAHKVADYKPKSTQIIEEQQATNKKLDIQNALLSNISDTLIEILQRH